MPLSFLAILDSVMTLPDRTRCGKSPTRLSDCVGGALRLAHSGNRDKFYLRSSSGRLAIFQCGQLQRVGGHSRFRRSWGSLEGAAKRHNRVGLHLRHSREPRRPATHQNSRSSTWASVVLRAAASFPTYKAARVYRCAPRVPNYF